MNYCSHCGQKVNFQSVIGDHLKRYVCGDCDTIHYQNPNVVTGCLPIWEDKILLCKRAIEPRKGFWNIPGGYLENGETVEAGAVREVWEEACAKVEVIGLHTVFSIPRINQVYMHFLAHLPNLNFAAGEESLEVELFTEAQIPWEEIAFTSSTFSLQKYLEDQRAGIRQVHLGGI